MTDYAETPSVEDDIVDDTDYGFQRYMDIFLSEGRFRYRALDLLPKRKVDEYDICHLTRSLI